METDACNFQHPPGAESRSFIASVWCSRSLALALTCGYSRPETFSASLVRACSATSNSVAYCNGRIPACARSGLAGGLKDLSVARSNLTASFPVVRGCSQQVQSLDLESGGILQSRVRAPDAG